MPLCLLRYFTSIELWPLHFFYLLLDFFLFLFYLFNFFFHWLELDLNFFFLNLFWWRHSCFGHFLDSLNHLLLLDSLFLYCLNVLIDYHSLLFWLCKNWGFFRLFKRFGQLFFDVFLTLLELLELILYNLFIFIQLRLVVKAFFENLFRNHWENINWSCYNSRYLLIFIQFLGFKNICISWVVFVFQIKVCYYFT